jgi:ATP-binding cassette, subfamily B, bacterial PglK
MFRQFKQFYKLFCADYNRSFIIAIGIAIVASILEVLGIASVIPFLKLLTAKDGIEAYPWLSHFLKIIHCHTPLKTLIILCFFIVGVFIVKNLYMIYYHHVSGQFLVKIRNNICDKFLNSLFKCHYTFFLKKNSEVFINSIDNTARYVVMTYMYFFMYFLVNGTLCFFIFSILIYYFFYPTLISLAYGMICFLMIKKLIKKLSSKVSQDSTSANSLNIRLLQSMFFSAKELKVTGTEQHFIRRAIESSRKVNYLEQLGRFLEFIPSYLVEIAVIGLFFLLIVVMGVSSTEFQNLIPHLGLLAVIIFRLAPIVNRLLTAYSGMKSHQGSIHSLNTEYGELLSHAQKDASSDSKQLAFKDALRMNNLCYAYNSGKEVLQDINISIIKHEFIGIVGPSGAGKTTLVDIILGLLKPSAGAYMIDEQLVSDHRQIACLFGYVAQNPFIITGTIEDNIALGRPLDREKIKSTMEACKLHEFHPEDTIMEFGKSLSGGQKQRIAIARALYGDPEILILDEATSSLDLSTEAQITNVINGLKGKCTIITIAHRLSTLQACDKLLYVKSGKVVACDSFSGLYANFDDFKKMVNLSNIDVSG